MDEARSKPKLAVWKFASCDGCQNHRGDDQDDEPFEFPHEFVR